jgi:hypothetical protein
MNRKADCTLRCTLGVAIGFLMLCSVVAIASALQHNEETFKTQPYNFDQEDVKSFLRAKGINLEGVRVISRDAFGTKLFIFPFPDQTGRDRMITITSNGIETATLPGTRCYPDNDGQPVAWFGRESTKTIHFKGGETLTLSRFDLFDVAPGGEYFIVADSLGTWIGRIGTPNQRVLISKEVRGTGVFSTGHKIYICGHSSECVIVSDDGKSFQVQGQRTFGWASGIVDVDPYSERLLLWDKWDEFNSVYLCDLATNRRRRLGFARRFQFFLADDLLRSGKTDVKSRGVSR